MTTATQTNSTLTSSTAALAVNGKTDNRLSFVEVPKSRSVGAHEDGGKRTREHFDAMPTLETAMSALRGWVTSEHRRDVIARLSEVKVRTGANNKVVLAFVPRDSDGNVIGAEIERPIETGAFTQTVGRLCSILDLSPPGRHLASLATSEHDLVDMCQYIMTRLQATIAATNPEATIKFRDRDPGIFGAVSASYPSLEESELADIIMGLGLPATVRSVVKYNGGHGLYVDIIDQMEAAYSTVKRGETFRKGIRMRYSVDGSGAFHVSSLVFQAVCTNMCIVDDKVTKIDSIRHRGALDKLRTRMTLLLRSAASAGDTFFRLWTPATEEIVRNSMTADPTFKIPGALSTEEVIGGVIASLSRRNVLPLGVRKAKALIPRFQEAFAADVAERTSAVQHGLTRAALVNAVTRVARDTTDDELAHGLEVAGGRILNGLPLTWRPVEGHDDDGE